MSPLRITLFLLLGLGLLGVGARFAREADYGAGPRDSSGDPAGPLREIALVSNVVGGSVSLIDLQARAVLGELDIKPDGARVSFFRDPEQSFAQPIIEGSGGLNYAQDTDLSRDGRVLFVSRGHLGDVAAFDIGSGRLLWRTPVAGIRADHMTRSPDGERLYVSALVRGGDVVEVLDAASGARLGSFATGLWPHDVHTNGDGSRVYAASLGDMQLEAEARGAAENAYEVTVVRAEDLAVLDRHRFDAGIRPFAITADERRLYAQLSNTHAVIAYDLETREVVARLDLPRAEGIGESDWDFEAPHHGLALTPEEDALCLAGRASDYAAVVATDGLELLATVPVGDAPSWAELDAEGELCVLANTRSDDVSIVSLTRFEEIARLPVGRAPKHVTIGLVPETVLATVSTGRGSRSR
ncbi:MAG: YncE family protein [Pseudomonadales bacterium]|jgi:DNA-binding beta-propeller fold protein YncE|nr:YncE family protein [Pseudomonadales bacterium]